MRQTAPFAVHKSGVTAQRRQRISVGFSRILKAYKRHACETSG